MATVSSEGALLLFSFHAFVTMVTYSNRRRRRVFTYV